MDLSFLQAPERETVLEVLQRDKLLRSIEENRIRRVFFQWLFSFFFFFKSSLLGNVLFLILKQTFLLQQRRIIKAVICQKKNKSYCLLHRFDDSQIMTSSLKLMWITAHYSHLWFQEDEDGAPGAAKERCQELQPAVWRTYLCPLPEAAGKVLELGLSVPRLQPPHLQQVPREGGSSWLAVHGVPRLQVQ